MAHEVVAVAGGSVLVSHICAELGNPPCPDDRRRVLAVVRYLDR